MNCNKFFQLIIFFLMLFICKNTQASFNESELRIWSQEKAELLLSTFNQNDIAQKYAKLDELFINYVDLEYIGKFVVGKYWREMTDEQKTTYISLFKRYSLGLYKTFPLDFDTSQVKYEITAIDIKGDKAEVSAYVDIGKVTQQHASHVIPFSLKLHKKDNKLQIIDIKLAESSLILSYRSKFYEIFTRNDNEIEWFLEDLTDMTISVERNNELKLQNRY